MTSENYGARADATHPLCGIRELTERQVEVLRWVKDGKSSSDIGEILGISASVVDEHVKKACERLRVRTRIQAVMIASERRYFQSKDPQT